MSVDNKEAFHEALKVCDEEMAAREERDFVLAAASIRESNEHAIDQKIFTSEAFQKAFAAMDQRKRPTEVIKLSGALLFEIAGGPVRCRVCDDDCLVESLYDRGPGLAPCFESCPNMDEPWHVKR